MGVVEVVFVIKDMILNKIFTTSLSYPIILTLIYFISEFFTTLIIIY